MKHLLTAIACCLAVAGSAQTPYNPDSNGDNFIGSHDLLDFLPLYDSQFFPTDSNSIGNCYGIPCAYGLQHVPVDIDETTDFVRFEFISETIIPHRINLPVDSSWKKIFVAASNSGYNFHVYADGSYIGYAAQTAYSMNVMGMFIRDDQGNWYWNQ